MAKTNIQISKDTKDLLYEQGKFGEAYDDVIQRLIKELIELRRKDNGETATGSQD